MSFRQLTLPGPTWANNNSSTFLDIPWVRCRQMGRASACASRGSCGSGRTRPLRWDRCVRRCSAGGRALDSRVRTLKPVQPCGFVGLLVLRTPPQMVVVAVFFFFLWGGPFKLTQEGVPTQQFRGDSHVSRTKGQRLASAGVRFTSNWLRGIWWTYQIPLVSAGLVLVRHGPSIATEHRLGPFSAGVQLDVAWWG